MPASDLEINYPPAQVEVTGKTTKLLSNNTPRRRCTSSGKTGHQNGLHQLGGCPKHSNPKPKHQNTNLTLPKTKTKFKKTITYKIQIPLTPLNGISKESTGRNAPTTPRIDATKVQSTTTTAT
jgi:hypothetical protein